MENCPWLLCFDKFTFVCLVASCGVVCADFLLSEL